MGLTIVAISNDYKYDEEKDITIGEEYCSTDIGYGGFAQFRNDFTAFISGNDLDSEAYFMDKELLWCYSKSEYPYNVITSREEFCHETLERQEAKDYLYRMEGLKEEYPKVFSVYKFLAHNDCEGEIDLETCKNLLPLVEDFYKYNNKNYGYSAWDYNFTKDFIEILKEVVNHNGKLKFE